MSGDGLEVKSTGIQPDKFEKIKHKAKFTLYAVQGNQLGEIEYCLHLEDPRNWGKGMGFIITVHADGTFEGRTVDHETIDALVFGDGDIVPEDEENRVPNLYAKSVRPKQEIK